MWQIGLVMTGGICWIRQKSNANWGGNQEYHSNKVSPILSDGINKMKLGGDRSCKNFE
jgi:hypothetical protein